MAVSHSAASESHTGTTGSTNQASFSWTHTQTGTPDGVLVFVHTISASNFISSVTYGGLALDRIAGAVAIDTAGEPGRTDLFFLGSGLGTGNQTITVNRTNNATIMYASAATVLAATNTFVTGILIEEQNQTLTVENIDDGSVSGTDSVRYCATYTGLAAPPAAGTASTLLTSIDLGAYGAAMVRETTAGQGSRPVGFSAATDDVAAVYVAIREAAAYSLTADVSNFTLVGIDADLTYTAVASFTAEAGTFTAIGIDAALAKGFNVLANTGSISYNGITADLRRTVILPADVGTFAEIGGSVEITRIATLTANTSSFNISSEAAAIVRQATIVAASRAFNVTGREASLFYSGVTAKAKSFYYQLHDIESGLGSAQVNSGQLVYYINNYLRIL